MSRILQDAGQQTGVFYATSSYQALLQQLQGRGSWYDEMSSPYGGMSVMGNDICCKLCLANLICNVCCCGGRGGIFYC